MKNNTYLRLKPIVSSMMNNLFKPVVEYEEEIPSDSKIILAGNHISNLDPILLYANIKRQVHFLAKEELFKGITKPLMNSLECIKVNREGRGLESIKESVNLLNDDKCILIFPEGTTNKSDSLILPFKLGTIAIAKRSRSDIIPFAITGNYKLIKNDLKLKFGKRIKINDYNSYELSEKLEEDIKTLILKK